jgi:hypothetical protein
VRGGRHHFRRPERPKIIKNGPCTPCRGLRTGCLIAARSSGSGAPAAPVGNRLRLLPSGPDLVHKPTPRGTRAIDAPNGGATGAKPLEREFSPARADCGFRAPLHPRLARSAVDPSANHTSPTGAPGRKVRRDTARTRSPPKPGLRAGSAPRCGANRPHALGCAPI